MVPACRQAGSSSLQDSMKFLVYAIKSSRDNRIYVGLTSDIEKRLQTHNNGHVFSTKGYRPWSLVYIEDCGESRVMARQREKYLKSGIGKEFLKKFIIPE